MSTGVNIPITGDASSLVAATAKANGALNSMGTTADKAGAKVEAGFKVSGAGVQKAMSAFGQIGGVLGKLSPAVGSAASSLTGLTAGFSGMAAAGATATVATGGVALVAIAAASAVAALAAAATGGAAALYTMGETLVTAGFKANDALAALEGFKLIGSDFYPVVPEAALKSFDQLAAAEQAVTDITSKLTVIIGANTGPVMAQITNTVIGLAVAALEMFEIWASGKNLLVEFARFVTGSLLYAFHPVTQAVLTLGRAFITLADLTGVEVAPGMRAALVDVQSLTDGLTGLATEGMGAAGASLSDYTAKGAAFIANVMKASKAVGDNTKAVKDNTAATVDNLFAKSNTSWVKTIEDATAKLRQSTYDDRVAAMGAMEAENARYAAKIQGLKDVAAEVAAAGGDEVQAQRDLDAALEAAQQLHVDTMTKMSEDADAKALAASEKARNQKISDQQAVGRAVIGLGNDLIAATTKQYDTTTKEGRAAAEKQFKNQKAAQMAMAVVAGALAIQQALSGSPPPANFIMAGITGAAAAIELGVIAASQPKFHMGTTGMRPDEYAATLQRGEGVVTSAGMSKPGMKETVAAANSGRTPVGTGGSLNMVYQHKVYNEFIRDNLKAGSPLTRRIDNGTKVGHRQSRS